MLIREVTTQPRKGLDGTDTDIYRVAAGLKPLIDPRLADVLADEHFLVAYARVRCGGGDTAGQRQAKHYEDKEDPPYGKRDNSSILA